MLRAFLYTASRYGGELRFHVGCPCICPSVRPSVVLPSVRISFPEDYLSRHQLVLTKLGKCIDIVELWFRIDIW